MGKIIADVIIVGFSCFGMPMSWKIGVSCKKNRWPSAMAARMQQMNIILAGDNTTMPPAEGFCANYNSQQPVWTTATSSFPIPPPDPEPSSPVHQSVQVGIPPPSYNEIASR